MQQKRVRNRVCISPDCIPVLVSFSGTYHPYSKHIPIEAHAITVKTKEHIPLRALIRCRCPRSISSTHPSPSIEDDHIKVAIIEDRKVIRASVLEMADLPEPQLQKILKLLDRPIETSALKLGKNAKSVSKHLDIQPTPTAKPKYPTKDCQAVPSLNREGNREGQQGTACRSTRQVP
ncbi:hypothetical protein IAS59_006248 [Cryptococcus gattii]